MSDLAFRIEGTAAPQGSMKHIGRGRLVSTSKHLAKWRGAVIAAAKAAQGEGWEALDGPVAVTMDFYLPRPRTTKFKVFPAGTPDLDKLVRAIGDSLTLAGAFTDDARIVNLNARKRWAIGCEPCAFVALSAVGDD